MRIGIDLTNLKDYQGTTVFAKELLSRLFALGTSGDRFFVFKDPGVFPRLWENAPRVTVVAVPARGAILRIVATQILIPILAARRHLDVLYSPNPFFSFFAPARKIITVHDCAYRRFREARNLFVSFAIEISMLLARRLGLRVVTVSRFSKNELRDLYDIDPARTAVISEGQPALPNTCSRDTENILACRRVTQPYFLYVGATRPRKNIPGLLRAFKIFCDERRGYHLVLAGKKDRTFLNIETEVKHLDLGHTVIETGFVGDEEKTVLCRNAIALVFPSFYEGFGLPVLEAQALGVPVIAADIPALRETAGSGAVFANPHDPNDIAAAMKRVADDASLRLEIARKGYENVKRFSWERSARDLYQMLTGKQ